MSTVDHGEPGRDTPDNEQPPYLIEGERVALGPLCRDLLPTFVRWNNDMECVSSEFTSPVLQRVFCLETP